MDPEPPNYLSIILFANLSSTGNALELLGLFLLLVLLIISSALISGSEISFFSLNHNDIESLEENDSVDAEKISNLIGHTDQAPADGTLKKKEKKLLATILIVNNFINIAIVIVSDYFIRQILGEEQLIVWGQKLIDLGFNSFTPIQLGGFINFMLTVVGVTFILVLFGEVLPKIYANVNNVKFAKMMVRPVSFFNARLSFLSNILVNSTSLIEKNWADKMTGKSITKEHIDKAIDITVEKNHKNQDELDILKGIVKFNDVTVKEIMKPRVDITALEYNTEYIEVLKIIRASGYSRIPVYIEDYDNIQGILYVKDLIGKKDNKDFKWQSLVRNDILYTPETKKIHEQLKEFQDKKVHIAIVVDEYGGSAGLVTLEDIMEEIIGEISDEFDDDNNIDFIKINKNKYVFDGKSSLHDVAKVMQIDSDIFNDYKGESDSIAGLLLEINGLLPEELKEFKIENLVLTVKEVNKRRIVKVQISKT